MPAMPRIEFAPRGGVRQTTRLLLLLALLSRLAVLAAAWRSPDALLTPDSHDYLRLARSLAETGIYGTPEQAEIFRTPGYPVFLALCLWLVDAAVFVCLLQCFIDVGTCWLVFRLTKRLFGPRAALVALFLQATCVVAIAYSCRVLSETVFTFLVVWFFDIYARRLSAPPDGRRRWWPAPAAARLALAAYVRAVALPLAWLPVAALAGRRRFADAALLGLVFLLLATPWIWRNAHRADYPRFASVADINLYRYNAAMLASRDEGRSFAGQQALVDEQFASLPSSTAVAEFSRREGLAQIRQAPLRYMWLHLLAVPRNLLPAIGDLFDTVGIPPAPPGTLGIIQSEGLAAGIRHYFGGRWQLLAVAVPATLWLAAVYALAAVGGVVVLLKNPQNRLPAIVLMATVAYFLLTPGGAAHPRFRVPAMPFIAIFAAVGAGVVTRLAFFRRGGEELWGGASGSRESFPPEAGRQLHRDKTGGGRKPFPDRL